MTPNGRSWFVGAALCAAMFSVAAPASQSALDAFLTEVKSLRADFVQTVTDADGYELQRVTGTLAVRRPGRFRWDYDGQVIVADGERVWMYDEGLAQVTVRPLDQTLASTPAMLLSGGDSLHEHAEVEDLGTDDDGLSWVAIAPRTKDTDFESVRIGFRGRDLVAMELVDAFGQTTRMTFVDLVRNPSIDDTVFAFDPPPGVDVIGEDAR